MSELLYQSERAEAWWGNALDAIDVDAVLGARTADALVFDAPYSDRTHSGHDRQVKSLKTSFARNHNGRPSREQAYALRVEKGESAGRRVIDYPSWGEPEVAAFSDIWFPRCTGWVVSLTDHVLSPIWAAHMTRHGRLVFPPVPLVETGSRVRMSGDGPSNWTCFLIVSRPRKRAFLSWGTLDGAYIQPGEREQNTALGTDRIVGAKPVESMVAIVEDYSRENALVVDPTFGGCTTGLACLRSGRRFIGMELDAGRAKLGAERVSSEEQHSDRRAIAAGQVPLFGRSA